MRRVIGIIAEIMIGGLLGGLAVRGAQALLGGGTDPALYEVATVGGYVIGVVAGVNIGGSGVGVGGSAFLSFLGALLGGILVRLAIGSGMMIITSLVDLFESSILSIAILGPILCALGYNLVPGSPEV
jgi:hypothetical protein